MQWDSASSNTVYCIILFIVLAASSVSLNTFPKHKNIMFVTAAVSPVWYKAEQQYSICLSKTQKKESTVCCFVKTSSICYGRLIPLDSGQLQDTRHELLVSVRGRDKACTACFCPRAWQLFPVVLFGAWRPPFLFPQGAGCSGAQLPPWWCLHGCLLPSGLWCPYWGGENTTTNPCEPAAPWTTAKGTGEGQGQLPQEQGGSCHPLGWPWWHTNPPRCAQHCSWSTCPCPAAGARQAPPQAAGLAWWHMEHTIAWHSLTGLQQMLHLKHSDKSGFSNSKITIW